MDTISHLVTPVFQTQPLQQLDRADHISTIDDVCLFAQSTISYTGTYTLAAATAV